MHIEDLKYYWPSTNLKRKEGATAQWRIQDGAFGANAPPPPPPPPPPLQEIAYKIDIL